MLGDSANEGVIPRVCRSIMNEPSHQEEGNVTTFTITYVEIFLERVRDLLKPPHVGWDTSKQSLKVREHPSDGPFVEGAIAADVETYEECMAIMEMGSKNRQVASTKMNQQSSRSHAIFTLHVTQSKPLDGDNEDEEMYTVVSKINLVDLAGSENAATAGSTGDRLKEGAAINKSLLSLGRVIKALADGGGGSVPVPSTPVGNSSGNGSGNLSSATPKGGARRVTMFEQGTGSRATPARKQRESYGGEGRAVA
jgi:kinesin family member 1